MNIQSASTKRDGGASLLLGALCVAGWTLCGLAGQAGAAPDGSASSVAALSIAAPAVVHAAPSVPTPMPVTVAPTHAIPPNVLFLVRNLPRGATISDGQPLSDAAWAVPLSAAPRLRVTLEPNAVGTADVGLQLVTYDGTVLAHATVTLVVGAPDTTTGAVSKPSAEDMDRARKFMQKGDENFRSGNIAAARLFYQRAADLRLAPAALALGGTYDINELRRVEALGVMQADPKEARKWYELAKALGDPEADRRLARLPGR